MNSNSGYDATVESAMLEQFRQLGDKLRGILSFFQSGSFSGASTLGRPASSGNEGGSHSSRGCRTSSRSVQALLVA